MGTLADHEAAALEGLGFEGSIADMELAFWASMEAGGGFQYRNQTLATAATDAETSKVTGDSNPRYTRNADGSMEWGPGNTAFDVTLYRAAVGVLRVDGVLGSKRALAADESFRTLVGAELVNRWVLYSDGKMEWGDGIAARDTTLRRISSGTLRVDNHLQALQNIVARVSAASQVKMGAYGPASEAGLIFGSADDTNLYRSAADILKTDDSLIIGTGLNLVSATAPLSGVIQMLERSDPANATANGSRLYTRDNGAGKTQLCVIFNTGAVQVLATEP